MISSSPRSALLGRWFVLAISLSVVGLAVACATTTAQPTAQVEPSATAPPSLPEFDVEPFVELNPNPEIRQLDREIDLGFYERERLPRDAIEPIYTPKFVSPSESTLRMDEMVMGLVINGDARAYPIGLLRVREMVNDEVGGTPVLVSW